MKPGIIVTHTFYNQRVANGLTILPPTPAPYIKPCVHFLYPMVISKNSEFTEVIVQNFPALNELPLVESGLGAKLSFTKKIAVPFVGRSKWDLESGKKVNLFCKSLYLELFLGLGVVLVQCGLESLQCVELI